MDTKHKILWYALLGFTLGLIVGIIMYVLATPEGSPLDKKFLIMHLIGSGIMGLVGYGGSVVYDFEEWSLFKVTITHYSATFMTMLIISTILGWFPKHTLFTILILFTIAYMIIWLTQYIIWKRQVRKMNEELKDMFLTDKITEQTSITTE